MPIDAESYRIIPIDQHIECVDTIVSWIAGEWGTSSLDEFKQSLIENRQCPPTLIAVSEDEPIAVLAYKLYPSPMQGSLELWVNALYVATSWRGRGIGSHLLREGVKIAASWDRTQLYAYTEVPQFYERLGWRRLSDDDVNEMHVVEIRIR